MGKFETLAGDVTHVCVPRCFCCCVSMQNKVRMQNKKRYTRNLVQQYPVWHGKTSTGSVSQARSVQSATHLTQPTLIVCFHEMGTRASLA